MKNLLSPQFPHLAKITHYWTKPRRNRTEKNDKGRIFLMTIPSFVLRREVIYFNLGLVAYNQKLKITNWSRWLFQLTLFLPFWHRPVVGWRLFKWLFMFWLATATPTTHIHQFTNTTVSVSQSFRSIMGLNKKSSEKYFEKDPFLVPISNNNTAYVLCCEEKPRLSCPGEFWEDSHGHTLVTNQQGLRYDGFHGLLPTLPLPDVRDLPHPAGVGLLHRLPPAGGRPGEPRPELDRAGVRWGSVLYPLEIFFTVEHSAGSEPGRINDCSIPERLEIRRVLR